MTFDADETILSVIYHKVMLYNVICYICVCVLYIARCLLKDLHLHKKHSKSYIKNNNILIKSDIY